MNPAMKYQRLFILFILLTLPAAVFAQAGYFDSGTIEPVTVFTIDAQWGYGWYFFNSTTDDGAKGISASVQGYYGWVPGFSIGGEIALLTAYSGTLNLDGTYWDATMTYLPVSVGCQLRGPDSVFFGAVVVAAAGFGYAPFIGSVQRISGTGAAPGDGFFFAKVDIGLSLTVIGAFSLRAGVVVYIPFSRLFTPDSGGFSVSSNMPDMLISLRAGILLTLPDYPAED
jgi:hypothetical protein